MQDLSALTPPLLMAGVVVLAIVAFLRHEMNRSRPDEQAEDENAPATGRPGNDDRESQQHDPDARRATSGDR